MVRKRVVLFSNAPYFGGAEVYLVYLAGGLRERGWDPVGLIPGGPSGEVLERRLRDIGVRVETYRPKPWMSPTGAREIFAKLRDLEGEVLHMNLPSPYEALRSTVALWARVAGYARVVATEHLPMVPRARRRVLLKVMLEPAVDAFIVLTQAGVTDLHLRHGISRSRIVIVPNGIDAVPEPEPGARGALLQELALPEDSLLVGHVGALTARKGHRFLLEALNGLRELLSSREVHILLVGEGEERENLSRTIESLSLTDRVHILGHREDARSIIGLLDLLVLPSLIEAQPLVILEAMSVGTPVLSTGIYAIPDMIVSGETGLLVPPGDSAALAMALSRMIRDDAWRAELGEAGTKRYRDLFTVDHMTESTLRVYRGEMEAAA
jgi:glycosyltransferase involved in cell wall biosynthesis